jgi:hypothetical protein
MVWNSNKNPLRIFYFVLHLGLDANGHQVVKSSSSVAQEAYASWIARELLRDIPALVADLPSLRVPELRLTCWQDPRPPYGTECVYLEEFCRRSAPVVDRIYVQKLLNKPVLEVMEFVQGDALGSLHPLKLHSYLACMSFPPFFCFAWSFFQYCFFMHACFLFSPTKFV